MSWHVYVIQGRDGVLYTGITTDVARRLRQHDEGKGAKFTRGRGPWTVVFTQRFDTKSEALREELRRKRLPKSKRASADNTRS